MGLEYNGGGFFYICRSHSVLNVNMHVASREALTFSVAGGHKTVDENVSGFQRQ